MNRKKRKQSKKKQPFLTDKQRNKVASILAKAISKMPRKHKFYNQTFVDEKGEIGCFPFGNFYKDICMCKYCHARNYCDKPNYPPRHQIISGNWRVCNKKEVRNEKLSGTD